MKSLFTASSRLATTLVLISVLFAFAGAPTEAKSAKMRDILDTVSANPILTKFASMILACPDIGTFLSSRGPFTVFAPTDSAFSKLPPGTLEALLRPENKVRLEDILLFHVVNGKRLTSKDLLPLKQVVSCQGAPLTIKTSHLGTQYVMKSKIISTDLRCENGIINEIDTVLMPPESVLPPLATAPPPTPAETPSTNAATETPSSDTNAPPLDTNNIPVAPIAAPETQPH